MTATIQHPMSRNLFACLLFLPTLLCQAAEFPEGASVPTAEELRQRLSDKTYAMTLADGTVWRTSYKSNGYFFTDHSTGYRNKGEWRTEDGRICTKLSFSNWMGNMSAQGGDEVCSEARIHEGQLYTKSRRADDQILRLVAN